MTAERTLPVCPCGCEDLTEVFAYNKPPAGETRFSLHGEYFRRILRCRICGHFLSRHDMDLSGLYAGAYVDASYREGLRRAFERIVALPPEKSDNEGRVARLKGLAATYLPSLGRPLRVLDVGSGLCVFLHRLKKEGWDCLALDPDSRAARHAEEVAGVPALAMDFETCSATRQDIGPFDVITLNKVLEHVVDPIEMLTQAKRFLGPNGFIYIELPDGEMAMADGPVREEFFIEHHHAFSMASTATMASRAGFSTRWMERLREPSGKYTLRALVASQPSERKPQ